MEEAYLIEPRRVKMDIMGLGRTMSTPADGITAEVIVIQDTNFLKDHPDKVSYEVMIIHGIGTGYGNRRLKGIQAFNWTLFLSGERENRCS